MKKLSILICFLGILLLSSCNKISQKVEYDDGQYVIHTWNTYRNDHYDYDNRIYVDSAKYVDSIRIVEYRKAIKIINSL
jgi:hypothetical protein